MSKAKRDVSAEQPDALFDRVITILEEARGGVVRAVNTSMVAAYWLIGREIVEAVQGGEERAEYGKQIIENLSVRLTERYGKGFSERNLQVFRQFYLAFRDRSAIPHPAGAESEPKRIPSPPGTKSAAVESPPSERIPSPSGRELAPLQIRYPTGTEFAQAFSPLLSWSHYRALTRVKDAAARDFYEREAAECGWSKAQLERQIQSSYYQRILANRGETGLAASDRERLPGEPIHADDVLKSPYVLEFLGLPDAPELRESAFEQAIIENLRSFLLELGKGFSFVARQKHIRFDDEDFYVILSGRSYERCARVRTRSSVPSQQFEPHYSRKAAKNAESQQRKSNTRHKREATPLRSLRLRVSNAVPWCSLWLCVSSSVPIRVNPWLLFPGCGSAAPRTSCSTISSSSASC